MLECSNANSCTGCHACLNVCPKHAIKMVENEEGFLYPQIDKELCVDCGLCEKACPISQVGRTKELFVTYAAWCSNEEVRKDSSSGGIFYLLAKSVLEQGGVVFGVGYDEQFQVIHKYVENLESLRGLQGSKYVQSKIGNCYVQAKKILEEGRKVLFSGTPCQIAGLNQYLGKEYENLITQDLICHGVPSLMVFRDYLTYMKGKYGKISCINFREKNPNWIFFSMKILFKKLSYCKTHDDDLFMKVFLNNTILRYSCYDCKFLGDKHQADITLADYWGVEQQHPDMFDNKGTSLVIINSEKALQVWHELKAETHFKKIDGEKAIQYNPSYFKSVKCPSKRKHYFSYRKKHSFEETVAWAVRPTVAGAVYKEVRRFGGIVKRTIKNML